MVKLQYKRRVMAFDAESLSPELIQLLEFKGDVATRSEYIKKALEFYFEFTKYPKAHKIRLINENFEEMKHYLRQIGNTRSKIKEKEKEFMKTK
jgi:hypothetical protein